MALLILLAALTMAVCLAVAFTRNARELRRDSRERFRRAQQRLEHDANKLVDELIGRD